MECLETTEADKLSLWLNRLEICRQISYPFNLLLFTSYDWSELVRVKVVLQYSIFDPGDTESIVTHTTNTGQQRKETREILRGSGKWKKRKIILLTSSLSSHSGHVSTSPICTRHTSLCLQPHKTLVPPAHTHAHTYTNTDTQPPTHPLQLVLWPHYTKLIAWTSRECAFIKTLSHAINSLTAR